MKLRVGVVGLGTAWETRHRSALRTLSDRFEVRAICEPVAHLAENAARDFQAVAIDGFRALCRRQDIDAVLVLSAHYFGSLPILAACNAGKAVYCASAFDFDPAESLAIRAQAEQSGIAFVVEFPLRQAPATLRLKELIATQLGRPKLLFCHRRVPAGQSNGQQRATARRELMEMVDWCRYVVGQDATSVVGVAQVQPRDAAHELYQMMSLDFSPAGEHGTGAIAQLSCGRYFPSSWHEAVSFRPPAALQVACEHGIAFIDLPATLTWFDHAGRHMEMLDSERPVGEQMLQQFYRAVTSLVRQTASLDDAFRPQEIVRQAEQSFVEGRRVWLDQPA